MDSTIRNQSRRGSAHESQNLLIRNIYPVLPDHLGELSSVRISSARIDALLPADAAALPDETIIDGDGGYLTPGFVDLHLHGGAGSDTMDGNLEDLKRIAQFSASGGDTGFLATTAADSWERLEAVLEVCGEVMNTDTGGARVLGVHVEGPYFTPEMRGCHLEKYLHPPIPAEVNSLIDKRNVVRSITLSPELPGMLPVISRLSSAGIVVSAGHTAATTAEMLRATDTGLRHVTHMYSAMSSVTKNGPYRTGGVVEAVYLDDRLTTEIIADGHHLPPELMKLVLKIKGPDKTCLVSDAMRGAGMPDGEYTFGGRDGQVARIEEGIALMPDRSGFASSVAKMNQLVRNAVEMIGLSLPEAVRMASLTPCRILGLERRKGTITPGKDADLALLGDDFEVRYTVVGGRVVYDSRGTTDGPEGEGA